MLSELDNYLTRIEDLHRQITGLLAEAPSEALNWRPIEGADEHVTNSLAVLTAHLAGAEHYWVGEVVGGHPRTRNRDAEFVTVASSTDELLQFVQTVARETRDVFTGLRSSDLDGTRQVEDRTIPVRWCILHVIDHNSLHLGHMQITYQLWSGGKGVPAPLWYERLPRNQGS